MYLLTITILSASAATLIFAVIYLTIWKKTEDSWEYGWCKKDHARRHKVSGVVQFLSWKPGEQGWAKGMWQEFGAGHETDFFPWEDGNVRRL